MGVSPYRWFLNARVKHAQTLLLGGTLRLADIAARLGFAGQCRVSLGLPGGIAVAPMTACKRGGDDALVDTHTPPRFSAIRPGLDVGHRPRVGAAGQCVLVIIEYLEANAGIARERIDERGD